MTYNFRSLISFIVSQLIIADQYKQQHTQSYKTLAYSAVTNVVCSSLYFFAVKVHSDMDELYYKLK